MFRICSNLAHHSQLPKFLSTEPSPSLLCRRGRSIQAALADALSLSSKEKSPLFGAQVHAHVVKLGFSDDTFSQNNLLAMYSRHSLFDDALHVFDEMPTKNLVSWTSAISGAVHCGELETGLELHVEMMRSGFRPNEFAFGSVLSACAGLGDVMVGACFHCVAVKVGYEMNLFAASSLLHMYARCGDIGAAECLLGFMSNVDIACWNAMVGGYANNGHGCEAMELVRAMHREGMMLDLFTFVGALKACTCAGDLMFGEQVHGLVVRKQMECVSSVENSLISMYFKAGAKGSALKLFVKSGQKDIVTWNTVFSSLAEGENANEAVEFLLEMMLTGLKPNRVTFSLFFRLCGALNKLHLGLQLFSWACHLGFLCNALVSNALIDMFSRCGATQSARLVFDSLLPARSIISWNEMISGYNLNGCSVKAFEIFCMLHVSEVEANEFSYSIILGACSNEHEDMGRQIHCCTIKSGLDSDCFVGSALINTYASFGEASDLFKVFQSISILDAAPWGSMISAFSQLGCYNKALAFFSRLIDSGEKPDEFILSSILNVCAKVPAYNHSKCIHSQVIKAGFEEHSCVASSIIDVYAKCGDISSSEIAFDCIMSRNNERVLFNTMITAYAQHGLLKKATDLFEKMKLSELKPSHATFVSVISACGHLGHVDQGRKTFDSISSDHGMNPSKENFGCLIDLYARSGFFREAKDVIEEMPFEPWPAVWRSLLNGCRLHGNKELAELAAQSLLQLEPRNDAAHVLLMKIYAEKERWEDVRKVVAWMKQREVRKETGYSRIEI